MEHAGKRYASICFGFVLISGFFRIPSLFEASKSDLRTHHAPGGHYENGVRQQNYEVRAVKSYADES